MRVDNTTLKVIRKLVKPDFLGDVIRDDYGTAIKRWLPKIPTNAHARQTVNKINL